ncbi:MAG: FliA/WhiG family RNA polymerase sigma factor [Magnetococcales bacterium]|nr:FliA/WhiG family RNA polymerase sigma factor [Magnetococcales bacterium]
MAVVTQKKAESLKDPADNDQGATWEGLSRDEVILKYAPIVKYVASRISMKLPQSVEIDDLVQVGILGLIDAVSKFDPHRGIKFQTYAEFRVRGAILDELRSMDWVPRAVRQTAAQIQETYLLLEGQMGKSVEDQEVAAHLGLSLDEFYRSLDAVRGIAILSFDDLRPSLDEEEWDVLEMLADPEIIDPVESIGLQQLRLALSEAISALPEKERLVVTLYYFEELTMSEIGEVLGLTESRISQLHSKAALRMRARMKRVLGRIS